MSVSELAKLGQSETLVPADIKRTKAVMYNARRSLLPPFPKTLESSIERIRDIPLLTSRGECYLQYSALFTDTLGINLLS